MNNGLEIVLFELLHEGREIEKQGDGRIISLPGKLLKIFFVAHDDTVKSGLEAIRIRAGP